MGIRVLTNIDRFESGLRDPTLFDIDHYPGRPRGLRGILHLNAMLMKQDYALINCSPIDLFVVCGLKLVNPLCRCRIVAMDTVLPVPRPKTLRDRFVLRFKILLFRQVHLFIEYFKDTRGYEHYYRMPRDKFRYVPFKINRYERVIATKTSDEGYIFCGGITRRDFATLIAAVRDLPYPVRIVTMKNAVIERSGSFLDESSLPPNVQVVRHDGSESFIDHIAGARLVALPVKKENISASGIGVYLASMALGKCVVISSGPAVDGVIPEGSAIVVPPEDPQALRQAIVRAYSDDSYRDEIARKAHAYARSLQGEERLYGSAMEVLADDYYSRGMAGSGRAA